MRPTTFRKLAAVASVTVFSFAAAVHAQVKSAPSTQPAQAQQSRGLIWDRTRVAVDRAQQRSILNNVVRAEEAKAKARVDELAATGDSSAMQAARRWINSNLDPEAERTPLVKAAYLGVATSPAGTVLRKQLGVADGCGLIVEFVEPGSPAAGAGVEPYDVLVRLNEQILVNPQQLAVLVRTFDPGTEVMLALIREQEPAELRCTLAEREMKPLALTDFAPAFADSPLEATRALNWAPAVVEHLAEPADPFMRRPASAPNRVIEASDLILVSLKDVEGPGVATVKRELVGDKGTLRLPRLDKPVRALGCTPVELEKSLRTLYREIGVEGGGRVDVFLCPRSETQPEPITTAKTTAKTSAKKQ